MKPQENQARYPGIIKTGDGNSAIVAMETAASEAAGAYPITPATPMGEGWADAAAAGMKNVNGRSLLHFEAAGEHAAAGVTAGMSLVGLRSTNFASGQGLAYMHESLYAAVGKRLTYVLNVACRAMTKQALNIYAGHDDYHAIDDTGCFQLFAADVQQAADLNLVAHRIAELSLNPGVCAQDGFLTSHVVQSYRQPEPDLIREFLGDPSDLIKTPTAAQRAVFGEKRRRIPELYDFDYPSSMGVVQNSESYAQGVAAQRPFYFDHIAELADRAFAEFEALTGRRYARAMGYELEDAEYVIVGQGSVVRDAEAVADYLRKERRLKVGVLNLTMFRPFPSDLVATLLAGCKGVVVLERTDQPLAVELPMIREIRAALAQAAENGRAQAAKSNGGRLRRKRAVAPSAPLPYPALPALGQEQVPDLYSACYGLGGRDLQPGDLVAAVENMLADGAGRRQYYLGIDFIDEDTPLPKVQIRQESVLADYPQLRDLALAPADEVELNASDSIELRIHSIGGWQAKAAGHVLAAAAAKLFGMHVKAFPTRVRERRGQPTSYSAALSRQPLRLNGELKHVDIVIAHDPGVFRHSDPLEGMRDGGILVIQSEQSAEDLWNSFPQTAQWAIRERNIRVCSVDGAGIANAEANGPAERYRLQGLAFMGAFFNAASMLGRHGLTRESLFESLRGHLSAESESADAVIEDEIHACLRGFDEVRALDLSVFDDHGRSAKIPLIPAAMAGAEATAGPGNQGAFWDQVCAQYKTGHDILADPFTAISAIPAATSSMRDMSTVRATVPQFVADKCTGCSKCWVQCPDSAIPGVVNSVEEILDATLSSLSSSQNPLSQVTQLMRHLARESHKILSKGEFETFGKVLSEAYEKVAAKMNWDEERRGQNDEEFRQVLDALADFPLAKTAPFFDVPEKQQKGSGGLLSITINPETCKGCDVCVAVCDDGALINVPQTDQEQERLEANWKLWKNLPETDDRFIRISSLEESIGMMPSLLLKQSNYLSMLGGDNACMGCGEKTAIHLVLSAVNALMSPRVEAHLVAVTKLIKALDEKARSLLISEADLADVSADAEGLEVSLEREQKETVARIHQAIEALKDLKWRYQSGPGGRGRARMGFANSTGCTSIWGATFPFNPYPFPWASHLFQDATALAVGLFEGHMRKMADGFIAVRRAQKLLDGRYDPDADEACFADFDWQQFSDEEFALCPPLFAVGGDGAMMDIGFQNLSRLMASGKPIRVVVVDTQGSSAGGGQSCTAGFTGQAPEALEAGPDYRNKDEWRKELALISIAHRNVFVMQSSQATPSHLFGNLLKGLQMRRPALFILNAPCPREWGIAQDSAPEAARLALESRAVPNLVFDPGAGMTFSECLDLEGNPSPDDKWPLHDLAYLDEEGIEQRLTLPLTIADWALGEERFRDHYAEPSADAELVAFHEYVEMDLEDREDCTPFIYTVDGDRRLRKVCVSGQIVGLAEERQRFWSQLRELAGVEVSGHLRDAVGAGITRKMQQEMVALKADYEAKFSQLTSQYPQLIARRIAEGLLRAGGNKTVAELMDEAEHWEGPAFQAPQGLDFGTAAATETDAPATSAGTEQAEAAEQNAAVAEEEDDDDLLREPWIESIRCTACDDCINLNPKMFAYNDDGLAYIADARAGTFKELVTAAEKCAPSVIHPGDPLNPDEKGLDKLIPRAEKFN
ncbi:MAG: 2-oxoacid:acceptor oxidoreductase family protein [Xanthomonadales bacterium]|jgi:pyruvate-ferredoxin/flavodoxin oxidoreductase|nr:2-oxoacid:acceptor oxidoreductase family protein [Xanthomonadales bacterium]MDH3940542.1 2-oxoacid:acceptor oxidoreductase family protein [Xanthomonadales bacterium]MDH4002106.1 2-oxoacid:acceptor oxidoreductase family protein [Xanthomonadales bacterium]